MNNLKLLLLLGVLLSFNNIVFSQKDILLDKKVIWIKSKKSKYSIVNEDKSYFNFNTLINKNNFLVGLKIKKIATNKESFLALNSNSKNSLKEALCIKVLLNDNTNKLIHFSDQSFIVWLDNNKIFSLKTTNYIHYNDEDYKHKVVFNTASSIRPDAIIIPRFGLKKGEPHFLNTIRR